MNALRALALGTVTFALGTVTFSSGTGTLARAADGGPASATDAAAQCEALRYADFSGIADAPTQVTEPFGGFRFQNQGMQFYKHPPAEAYGLNRLLFESRHSADLRHRIITDLETVAREYDLAPKQRTAAEEMVNVGKGGLVSDHVGPLVEAGAHPLQALMSLHVIFSTTHARGQQAMGAGPGKS